MARPSASSDVFRAVADPTRRAIIDLLAHGGATAGAVAGEFDLCQSTVSQHLAVLRHAGLVSYQERAGRRIYTLAPAALTELADWVYQHVPDR